MPICAHPAPRRLGFPMLAASLLVLIGAAAPPAAEAPPTAPTGDGVEEQVMAIVAAQTGYPSDLLDVDLDLEADLGIDTVKQAETFAAIRAAYDIERDDRLALRDYPTLRHVIAFVHERAPRFAATVDTPAPPAPTDRKSVV